MQTASWGLGAFFLRLQGTDVLVDLRYAVNGIGGGWAVRVRSV